MGSKKKGGASSGGGLWVQRGRALLGVLAVCAAVAALLALLCVCYLSAYARVCAATTRRLPSPDAVIALYADPQMEGGDRVLAQGWYGALNNWINDRYHHHVYASVLAAFQPDYAVLLGDIFSCQNLPHKEFRARLLRWEQVFYPIPEGGILSVVGNHDIGYGYEVLPPVVRRFETAFQSRVNQAAVFHGHVLATFNSMVIDGSKAHGEYEDTYEFLTTLRERAEGRPILLFHHIPLHKPAGVCVDAPFMNVTEEGFVADQTMLSEQWSEYILAALQPPLIFTGHDHNGCYYEHNAHTTEYTIPSMMGEFGGYAAVLEWSWDEAQQQYLYNVVRCPFVSTPLALSALLTAPIASALLLALLALRRFLTPPPPPPKRKDE